MMVLMVYLTLLYFVSVSNGYISLNYGQHIIDLTGLKKVTLSEIENTESFDEKWLKSSSTRFVRSAGNGHPSSHAFYLNGTENNNEAFVHWSGKAKSDAIFVLTRQQSQLTGEVLSSKLWRSLNYGASYTLVDFPKGAIVTYFYVSPVNYKKAIFLDKKQKQLYITVDELKTKTMVQLKFQPDHIMPHPLKEDWVLAYSFIARELYFSKDFGKTWKLLHSGVSPRFFWTIPDYDTNNSTVHLELISAEGGSSHYKRCTLELCDSTVSVDHKLGSFVPITLLVLKEYIFVEKITDGHSEMYVSYNRQSFKKAYFPPDVKPKDYIIVNADEGQVFIAVSHSDGVTLYLSDSTGQFYVPTLENVLFVPRPGWFAIDLHEVKSLKGTYLANQKVINGLKLEVKTYISFDKGGFWSVVPTPNDEKSKCESGKDCSLHLHLDMGSLQAPGILSEAKAPGLILAHGNVGDKLSTADIRVYASRDGGATWKNTGLIGYYRFNILDQGSILTAVLESSGGVTSDVNYSFDQGNNWNNYEFLKSGKKIQVDGVLNEPDINSLAISVYGHSTATEGWTLVTLNFSTVLPLKCKKEDYEMWLPGDSQQKNCTLGQTLRFERRRQSSGCYNGEDYEQPINHTPCLCQIEDYECDFGYEQTKVNGHEKCKPASWFDPDSLVIECTEGKKYNHSIGYRKVASDKCHDGIATTDVYKPVLKLCPVVAPRGLKLHTDKNVIATNTVFKIELTQSGGSEISTVYTWNFGDNSTAKVINGLINSSQLSHTYKTFGNYNITVVANNSIGTSHTNLFMRVEDKVRLLKIDIPWATRVGKSTLFDVIVANNYLNQKVNHTLLIWTWGDENGANSELSWLKTIHHLYSKAGTYHGSVEAINSVSSVYKQFTVHVFNETRTVRLMFSQNIEKYDLNNNLVLRVTFFELLKRELVDALGVQESRFVFHMNKLDPFTVDTMFTPEKKSDLSLDELSNKLLEVAKNKTLFVALDGQQDSSNVVHITGAEYINDSPTNSNINGSKKPNLRAVYIAIPILIGIFIITVMVLVYYKKRFREARRYTLLRNRNDEDNQLLGDDDDDDDPPIDLNPEFGTDRSYHDDQLDLGTGSHLVMVTGGRITDDD